MFRAAIQRRTAFISPPPAMTLSVFLHYWRRCNGGEHRQITNVESLWVCSERLAICLCKGHIFYCPSWSITFSKTVNWTTSLSLPIPPTFFVWIIRYNWIWGRWCRRHRITTTTWALWLYDYRVAACPRTYTRISPFTCPRLHICSLGWSPLIHSVIAFVVTWRNRCTWSCTLNSHRRPNWYFTISCRTWVNSTVTFARIPPWRCIWGICTGLHCSKLAVTLIH